MIIRETKDKELMVDVPLTNLTGKVRIKKRSLLNEYGTPVFTKREPFSQSCYVEWQIGYDATTDDKEKMKGVHFPSHTFIGANSHEKTLYELSEFVKYFYDWKIVGKKELIEVRNYLLSLKDEDFLDNAISHPELAIKRTNFVKTRINEFDFMWAKIEYPLLVYKFNNYEIITEITIKEKQKAVGVQPMLFLCFPITELENAHSLLGRTAKTNETAVFKIDFGNICVFVEMLKLFGTLSKNHNIDVLRILDVILK